MEEALWQPQAWTLILVCDVALYTVHRLWCHNNTHNFNLWVLCVLDNYGNDRTYLWSTTENIPETAEMFVLQRYIRIRIRSHSQNMMIWLIHPRHVRKIRDQPVKAQWFTCKPPYKFVGPQTSKDIWWLYHVNFVAKF